MSGNRISGLLVGLLLLLASPTWGHADDGVEDTASSYMHRGTSAKPIVRRAPRYPKSELRSRRQGWVELSYVVTEDGQIVDPVVENSSGSNGFEREALRVVKKWSYEPATWDGTPVQQCHTKVLITFALNNAGTGVTRKFLRRYKAIDTVIAERELDKAQQMVDNVEAELNLTLSETAWLWTLRARLAGLIGDDNAKLAALRKATRNGGKWIDDDLYPRLLLARTALELADGNYSEALRSHQKLVRTGNDHPLLAEIEPYVEEIQDLVAGETVISVPARIGKEEECVDCATNWHYRPLRRKFSIADVDGRLTNIEFRCPWQRIVDTAREGAIWNAPEEWGRCSIIVFGEPGTTFSLLELPSA